MNEKVKDGPGRTSARALLKQLQERFPVIGGSRPLAIGIDAEIIEVMPEVDRKLLRAALRMHTGSTRYLKATERGRERFNLANQAVAQLSAEHRERAAVLLKERFARQEEDEKARLEAEAQARRTEKLEQLASKFSRPTNRQGS